MIKKYNHFEMKRWHKWTKGEHRFLVSRFGRHGDTELARMFNERFPKAYPWTKKHIEKRRNYFGLKRSKEQEHRLRVFNNGDGRHYKMWDTRGRMKEGEIRQWGDRTYIKHNGIIQDYYRHIVGAKPGQVARKHEGLIKVITKAENQRLNALIRADRPIELKEAIKQLNRLKKVIHEQEDSRPQRHSI